MKMKQRLKGFTLIELVIVMALFSLIMFSVLQLLVPVSQFFVRSANFENTTSCLDNMKRAIEGNLKYADRVRLYVDYQPYDADAAAIHDSDAEGDYRPSADMIRHVQNFYDEFFGRNKSHSNIVTETNRAFNRLAANNDDTIASEAIRQYIDCRGTIYVMVFDNTAPANYTFGGAPIDSLQTYNEQRKNTGKIVMYEFNFDNTGNVEMNVANDVNSGNYIVRPWYVNPRLYGCFDYQFILNNEDAFTQFLPRDGDGNIIAGADEGGDVGLTPEQLATLTRFRPEDCTITIESFEIKKVGGSIAVNPENMNVNGTLVRNLQPHSYVSSFSMKNVLNPRGANANVNYQNAMNDYKIFRDPSNVGYDHDSTNGHEYFQDSIYWIPRYWAPFIRTDAVNDVYRGTQYPEPYTGTGDRNEGFTPAAVEGGAFSEDLLSTGVDLPGFYFIFTLPETTDSFRIHEDPITHEIVCDDDDHYLEAVNNEFRP